MKALVKKYAEPGLWLDDVPEPEMGSHDVLVKIKKTAVCGTDLHIYNWDEWAQKNIPVPMPVGHEFVGIIEAIGSDVYGLKVGERVSGEGHITCGICRNCRAGRRHLCAETQGIGVNRQGCFAEYLSIPAKNVFPVPDHLSDDIASILDPLGNATHTALSFDLVGEDILITGAGPIGLMAVAIARHAGARFIVATDPNPVRRNLAKQLGANDAIDPLTTTLEDTQKKLGMREGFDVGFEMSGNAVAFNDMLRAMHHGGQVALLGIPPSDTEIDWNQVIFKGLMIKGIYGREMFETWYKMASMLQSGLSVDAVITHHLPYTEFEDAFSAMKQGQSGKVILEWAR